MLPTAAEANAAKLMSIDAGRSADLRGSILHRRLMILRSIPLGVNADGNR